ncbi:hypothetical protein CsSME_00037285 [Camellia sinensis var. sinensis]
MRCSRKVQHQSTCFRRSRAWKSQEVSFLSSSNLSKQYANPMYLLPRPSYSDLIDVIFLSISRAPHFLNVDLLRLYLKKQKIGHAFVNLLLLTLSARSQISY